MFIEEYKALDSYEEEQALIAAYAAIPDESGNVKSIHSLRATLVKLGVYKNKPKTTKVYKSDLVDKLVETLEIEVTDSEHEYLNRLTVTLLRKILAKIPND